MPERDEGKKNTLCGIDLVTKTLFKALLPFVQMENWPQVCSPGIYTLNVEQGKVSNFTQEPQFPSDTHF